MTAPEPRPTASPPPTARHPAPLAPCDHRHAELLGPDPDDPHALLWHCDDCDTGWSR